MILYIDVGNTRVKWQYQASQRQPSIFSSFSHQKDWVATCAEISQSIAGSAAPHKVVVASVLGKSEDALFHQQLKQTISKDVFFYYSEAEVLGFKNSYEASDALGVDRWLAIVEAWSRHGNAIVIDCGSALTVDVAAKEGVHLGGYIVPGLHLLVRSLWEGTSQVKVSLSDIQDNAKLGSSTQEAVNNGSLKMYVSFINSAIEDTKKTLGDCAVYLVGGDAKRLVPLLECDTLFDDNLVLSGLERVVRDKTS